MADELLRSRHAFGTSEGVELALEQKLIDERDILFLDEDTDNPKIGWIKKDGTPVILKDEKADLSEVEAEIDALESNVSVIETDVETLGNNVINLGTEVSKKADAETVTAELEDINSDVEKLASNVEAYENSHLKVKYEISDVPTGTLVDYRADEIRVMCPEDAVFTKQSVGEGGDPNTYYMTFKTYVPYDNAVGYVEHLNGQPDGEILTKISVDEYGRRYQPTWLGIAVYDESTDTWSYYGKSSSTGMMIGWFYRIDWYDAEGTMIGSDSIRINLSNEGCHHSVEPYYVQNLTTNVETKIKESVAESVTQSKTYTDEQVSLLMEAMTVIEF